MKPKKLKRFNYLNSSKIKIGKATIRFYEQGQISLSMSAVKMMNLKNGDRIEILQDQNEPNDWYITKSKDGFQLRKQSGTKGYVFNNKYTSRIFIKSFGKDRKSLGCMIGTEPEEYKGEILWSIITSSINEH